MEETRLGKCGGRGQIMDETRIGKCGGIENSEIMGRKENRENVQEGEIG